ncbi:MAG: GAF domain-containing protein [Limnochordia bacterium]|jgi:L-methionine (R)-S-oxide reductase|nr:GAF domain-containing protein [Bacillota bacterium]NLL09090.1 GAF domain-containing protein [Bacillota bacterium]HBG08983.1 hypothetical protein [Bacillota bacterium]
MYSTDYALLKRQLESLLTGEDHWLANLANTSALLFAELADLNWVGFYLLVEGELVLGPFQGKPACVRIPLGKGVCGTAAQRREAIVVPDVHEFPGHIVCDEASRSELVVPLLTKEERLLGVLDLDSPSLARFSSEDAQGLTQAMEILISATNWPEKF